MFSVRLSNKAEKQFKNLESATKSKAMELFQTLEQKPVPAAEYGVRKITGEEDTYRVRISSFRVLYRVFWQEKVVRISKIERRSDNTYD